MIVFDPETDRYLERLGGAQSSGDWNDVLRRAGQARRRSRRARLAAGSGVAVAATAAALATVAPFDELGGRSIVDKAQAAVLARVEAVPGTIERILVQYRTDSGKVFNEYETWIAGDGAWCRRTVEGLPGQAVADTQLTECRSSEGVRALYLPAENEILRARPGQPEPADRDEAAPSPRSTRGEPRPLLKSKRGKQYILLKDAKAGKRGGTLPGAAPADPGPAPPWLTENVIDAFRRDAVREAGTATLDGRVYTKLVTNDGQNAVLVDPDTGEAVAWIPSPKAFGVPTTVLRTRQSLPDDAATHRNLSLSELHPDATIRDVSAAELERAKASQYPRG